MLVYIEIAPPHYVRSDAIAGIQFKQTADGSIMASIVTTILSLEGTVHYDVHDAAAIEHLEALILGDKLPNPRHVMDQRDV